MHASSHPIIEHCAALRFAPYPALPPRHADAFAAAGLRVEQNEWQQVDDFDWLKATHSPNWAELPEAARVAPAFLEAPADSEDRPTANNTYNTKNARGHSLRRCQSTISRSCRSLGQEGRGARSASRPKYDKEVTVS